MRENEVQAATGGCTRFDAVTFYAIGTHWRAMSVHVRSVHSVHSVHVRVHGGFVSDGLSLQELG